MPAALVARSRSFGELNINDPTAEASAVISTAMIDRWLAPDRGKLTLRGRFNTKPGPLQKSQIPIRTWAQSDESAAEFAENDLDYIC